MKGIHNRSFNLVGSTKKKKAKTTYLISKYINDYHFPLISQTIHRVSHKYYCNNFSHGWLVKENRGICSCFLNLLEMKKNINEARTINLTNKCTINTVGTKLQVFYLFLHPYYR